MAFGYLFGGQNCLDTSPCLATVCVIFLNQYNRDCCNCCKQPKVSICEVRLEANTSTGVFQGKVQSLFPL